MSAKTKHQKRSFTFATIIRLTIFALIVYFLINYFSGSSNQSILGDSTIDLSPYTQQVTNLLPEKSQKTLENLPQSPVFTFIHQKIVYLQQESNGFPEKQIKEIKKAVIKDIYDKLLHSIEVEDQSL